MKASKFLVKPHAKANVKTLMEVRSQLDHLARVTLDKKTTLSRSVYILHLSICNSSHQFE